MTDKRILVDSGATDNFIDPRLITRLGLGTRNLERPRKIWNIDGTNNQAGMLTQYVDLSVRTGKTHNDPDRLPSLVEEPTVRIFRMSWVNRRRPKCKILGEFMGWPISA